MPAISDSFQSSTAVSFPEVFRALLKLVRQFYIQFPLISFGGATAVFLKVLWLFCCQFPWSRRWSSATIFLKFPWQHCRQFPWKSWGRFPCNSMGVLRSLCLKCPWKHCCQFPCNFRGRAPVSFPWSQLDSSVHSFTEIPWALLYNNCLGSLSGKSCGQFPGSPNGSFVVSSLKSLWLFCSQHCPG